MQTKCVKIKLKPDSIDRVREWANTINSRRVEALETLKNEAIVIEAVFLDSTVEGDFLIYFIKAQDINSAHQVFQQSKLAIDEYHRKFKRETWDEPKNLELLVDLENY